MSSRRGSDYSGGSGGGLGHDVEDGREKNWWEKLLQKTR